MKPSGEDLQKLSGRADDKFSQKVRNLKSHSTFENSGFAEYKGGARDGYVEITDKGREHLEQNMDILKYLLINDFTYSDIAVNLREVEQNQGKRKIEVFDENVIIQEGSKKIAETAVYERSSMLRDYAIKHFTMNGRIICGCCSFNFADFYGRELGEGFIEIHHAKPVFKYEDEDIEKKLAQAVNNLVPVCSNCHRMIHRNLKNPLEIQLLKDAIQAHGLWQRVQ